ncbi:hypothetical protein [Peptostreptococcus equinus]|uniref:AbrB/MazE/SpoVT family DNA-binding domain-containing protein n=1 Tax=Peptostreptococcus equinus TaxID=3003601 RepID=A0ABY7JUA5_9FIRM|nr:hypothetical protein [Peptostreptococcus sp. CBA3647]WAW15307.1 hypothetical protein O0R46_02310 [Peptostreptococcus sp. CBA3647]
MEEKRKAKIIFNKSGDKNKSTVNRVTLPVPWVRELGITEDDREVQISIENKKIIIEKL